MNSPSIETRILVIEDDKTLNKLIVEQLEDAGYPSKGVYSWKEARTYLETKSVSLALLDVRLPDGHGLEILQHVKNVCPVILLTAYATIQEAIDAVRQGAAEYLTKPVKFEELILTVERALENASLREGYLFVKKQLSANRQPFLVGRSPAMQGVVKLIDAVAPSEVTVLITGESGVGKELIAREIHERSQRSGANYVALDCCTLHENLFESELFGHEKGAFTGADRQKKGLIEGARGGTVFLDEIGEVSPLIQAKLLRVLETGGFRRLGGNRDMFADVRVIAATNRNLQAMVDEGAFRSDLFFRLNAFTIDVPPLRERREEIPDLVQAFLQNHDFSRRINKQVAPEAMESFLGYDWPGNIRELKNVVERAIIVSGEGPEISKAHLGTLKKSLNGGSGVEFAFEEEPTIEELKKEYPSVLLDKYAGHRHKVAKALGISERNTYRMIKKYGFTRRM